LGASPGGVLEVGEGLGEAAGLPGELVEDAALAGPRNARGGLTAKIHLVVDRRCRPIARILSPGQHGDSPRFIPLMEAIGIRRCGRRIYPRSGDLGHTPY
jgi:hypothetical protein